LQTIEQQSESSEQESFLAPQLGQTGSPVQSLSSQSTSVSQSLSMPSSQISGDGSQVEARNPATLS
jgi:hypothetical protein